MANILTGVRIICSVIILFVQALSPTFYVFYMIAGFSDMIDGTVARKTGSVSEFGSRFDSAADLIFIVVCLIRILPEIKIEVWLWAWVAVVAGIKIINIIPGFALKKRFVAEHTIMNKITGFMLFLLPLTLSFVDIRYSGTLVCAFATFAAIQEGHLIRTKSE